MNTTKSVLVSNIKIGETVDIATSQYSTTPNVNTGWNPKFKTSYAVLKSLEKNGVFEVTYFFRGATVKRLK